MTEKSYEQMKQEFRDFYFKEVKPMLPKFNEERKKGSPKIIAFWVVFVSVFVSCFAGFFWREKALFLVVLPFFAMLWLMYLTRKDKKNADGSVTIETDYEMRLKIPLMKKCMNIFLDNVVWSKEYPDYDYALKRAAAHRSVSANRNEVHSGHYSTGYSYNSYWDAIKKIKSQNIIGKFIIAIFDDIVMGQYKGVDLAIYETNTNLLKSKLLPQIIGLTVGCSGCVIVILVIMLIILLAILSKIFGSYGFNVFLGLIAFLGIYIVYNLINYIIDSGFRGIIVEIDMNKTFSGHTFFHEISQKAMTLKFNKRKFKKVQLESSTFENKYNVYSDNQIEARYLLTPSIMEKIENLSFAFKAKYVRGSFKDNKLTLAIHTGKDMFAMGSDFKDSDTRTFEELYDEMISILQIVDELKLNEHTNL
ncbi:DUF3137 domain-containing protein [bacterium]|nr:DUF3137 domain-containing protein [bacterium]